MWIYLTVSQAWYSHRYPEGVNMVPDLALHLEMKSNTVLITVIDNAKMLFEAGRVNVVD